MCWRHNAAGPGVKRRERRQLENQRKTAWQFDARACAVRRLNAPQDYCYRSGNVAVWQCLQVERSFVFLGENFEYLFVFNEVADLCYTMSSSSMLTDKKTIVKQFLYKTHKKRLRSTVRIVISYCISSAPLNDCIWCYGALEIVGVIIKYNLYFDFSYVNKCVDCRL